MIKIETFENQPIGENTYVVSDETREAVIIDCGALIPEDQQAIAQYVEREGLCIKHHLLTHGHFDHVFGAQWVMDTYGCAPRLHPADARIYAGAAEHVSAMFRRRIDFPQPALGEALDATREIRFGTHVLRVIHCPGHSPGGCCLYCEAEGVLFGGDSIFEQSIGRTDLEGGSQPTLIESLTARIMTLPPEVVIYPGHGPSTTVGYENRYNPYLPYVGSENVEKTGRRNIFLK